MGHRGEIRAGAWVPDRVLDDLPAEPAQRRLHGASARTPQDEQTLARADQDFRLPRGTGQRLGRGELGGLDGPARDRGKDVDAVVRQDLGVERHSLAVHEQRDVRANGALLVEHPAGEARVGALEATDHLAQSAALHAHLALAPHELAQRRP